MADRAIFELSSSVRLYNIILRSNNIFVSLQTTVISAFNSDRFSLSITTDSVDNLYQPTSINESEYILLNIRIDMEIISILEIDLNIFTKTTMSRELLVGA